MTKKIILLLMMVLFEWELQAQTAKGNGTSYWDPVQVTFSAGKATFADVHDTSTGPPWYYRCRCLSKDGSYQYTQGRAVHYQIELLAPGDLIIHNWNSFGVGFTTLFLLKPAESYETGEWLEGDLAFNRVATFEIGDFLSPDYHPEDFGIPEGVSDGRAYLHVHNLPAGIYNIVTAGYKYSNASVPNGILGTTIIADLSSSIPDEPEMKPEEPNDSPVQYQYDRSGNRIKTIKKQQ